MKRLVFILLTISPLLTLEGKSKFIEFSENDQAGALKTAIISYQKDSVTVDLIATVHIADADYYQLQNKRFKKYQALLFEMIGRAEHIQKGKRSSHPISKVQIALKNFLDLEFQLEFINYRAKNFVHADMTYEAFTQLSAKRGESLFSLMLKAMQKEMLQGSGKQISIFEILSILISGNDPNRYKLLLARQMQDIESTLAGIGDDEGTVIVNERNKVAIRVLKQKMKQGLNKFAIYYGAAHMQDFEQRLMKMGFKKGKTEWFTAWYMPKVKVEPETK